ncbi:hypothetical protein AOL_s00215g745 [Orbilia oligospora ATCC 24927]|uniref:RING-type domain-containing protein n=1 Tax=Arthrobotrys oligospora (strain ATCC 24927 / CBS 115.81 / DSM 1491) TaxID=756982 RepID=G1XUT7_ARTOA|nr:hypothetical protein AOL_s00215g745 [Orbilia oligospora ATCC 24927]EGX43136.1 hypothetical protein AOL_s00215g745 [Orbilia oligospora ATCC 24927]
MMIESPLSEAIAAQISEISMSKSHGHGDADFEFAVRLLQEDLRTLQQKESDPRVPRSSRRGGRPDVAASSGRDRRRPSNDLPRRTTQDSVKQAQIRSDRELAEALERGEDPFAWPRGTSTTSNIQDEQENNSEAGPNSRKVTRTSSKAAGRALPRGPLFGTPPSSAVNQQHRDPEQEISELKDILQALAASIGWTQDWEEDAPTTSASASLKRYKEELSSICNICNETYQNYAVFTLKCKHRYCVECLRDHILHAFGQPGSELPRCCGEALPLTYAGEVLMESELNQLMDRRDAQESSKQISCVGCKKDLLQGSIKDNSAYCIDCAKFTCIHCAKDLHDGICPEDKDMAMLLETAKNEGWSKCGKCNHLVELTIGCFHMTCRCGHQFCYLCGVEWKTCGCPSSSEHSVLGRIREATGKGAELLRQGWENSKAYVLSKEQLDAFKEQAMEYHREKMDLRQSLHRLREEKQLERQIAEQIILLRTEILEFQGQVDHAEMNRKRRQMKELEDGKALGEKIVAKGLKTAAVNKAKKPSKKGKERARDVEGGDTKVIMAKIMNYVNT